MHVRAKKKKMKTIIICAYLALFPLHLFHVHLVLSKLTIMNKPFGVDMCVRMCIEWQ
jgi:hypothetical protein